MASLQSLQSRLRQLVYGLCVLVLLAGFEAGAASGVSPIKTVSTWPAWRGPNANGSVSSGKFPESWSTNSIAWKLPLPGKGGSTPVVINERIFLTTPVEGEDAVMAVDLTGKVVWTTKLGPVSPAKHRTLGSSCNASPVSDGQNVFVRFRSGRLAAVSLDGKERWKVSLTEKFGDENLFWDTGSSPILIDDLIIVSRLHGGESLIAAFAKSTGQLRWQIARNYSTPTENNNGYSTPVPFQFEGRSAFLVWGADHLTAHAAADGHLLWSCAGFNPDGTGYWPAIASPVLSGRLAIVPVGRDDRPGQARVHAIKVDGHDDVTATHRVWARQDVGIFVTSPVVDGRYVYLLRHRGEVVCLDPANGKTVWANALPRGTASYYASPVVAGGILYAAREDGVVFAARVGEKMELLSENPMGERIVASPAVAGGRLLLRGDQHLFCIAGPRD